MTLLEKFDAVKLSDEDQIPSADKEWCEKEQADFNAVLMGLNSTETELRDKYKIEELIDKCHHYYEYPNRDIYGVSKSWDNKKDFTSHDGNYYDLFSFSSAYGIERIIKLKKKLKIDFVRNVTLYFVEKYNLDVPEFHKAEDQIDERCDYKVILKLIKEHLGGFLDFKGSAVEQAIIEIKKELQYQTINIVGHIIEFPRFGYKSRGEEHKYPDQHDNWTYKYFVALDKAISIFEKEEVKLNYAITYLAGQPAGDWDTCLNGEKVDSFKWFKNSKFQLKFKEAAYVNQFIQRFNFKTS